MSKEKTIRIQAKNALKGNWGTVIAAVMFVCAVFYMLSALEAGIGFLFEIFNLETGEVVDGKGLFAAPIIFVYLVLMIAVSPLLTGIYKMFYKIACDGKAELADIFYFFRSFSLFLRTVVVNFVTFFIFLFVCQLVNVSAYVEIIFENNAPAVLLFISGVITAVLCVLAYLIFVNFTMFAYVADERNKGFIYRLFGIYSFAVSNLGKSLKLLLSFAGWIALCFFVVPAFYVLPYVMTALATSAKWLFINEMQYRAQFMAYNQIRQG